MDVERHSGLNEFTQVVSAHAPSYYRRRMEKQTFQFEYLASLFLLKLSSVSELLNSWNLTINLG